MSDYLPDLIAEIEAHGVTDWTVDRSHPHPQLRFTHEGRRLMFVTPSSPSDRRGVDNALSDIRKLMGVRRIIHKSSAPPKRRNRTTTTQAPDSFTLRGDPFAVLAGVAAAMQDAATARHAGLRAFLGGGCDAPPRTLPARLAVEFRGGWWDGHRGAHV